MFVVDSWLLQDGNESEEKFLKSLREECITNVFAADRSTEKKKKKLCKASMLLGNDAKFLLRD